MSWKILKYLTLALCVGLCGVSAKADTDTVGFVSFDDLAPGLGGNSFALDITNFQQLGLTDVLTPLSFENLSLSVTYADGTTAPFGALVDQGAGSFSTGMEFAGGDVVSATLTGTFSPLTITLADGSTVAIESLFSASITDSGGFLQDGDFAAINVITSPIVTGAPEPGAGGSLVLGLALTGVLALRRRIA